MANKIADQSTVSNTFTEWGLKYRASEKSLLPFGVIFLDWRVRNPEPKIIMSGVSQVTEHGCDGPSSGTDKNVHFALDELRSKLFSILTLTKLPNVWMVSPKCLQWTRCSMHHLFLLSAHDASTYKAFKTNRGILIFKPTELCEMYLMKPLGESDANANSRVFFAF